MSQSAEKIQSPFLDVTSFPRQQLEILEENITRSAPISPSSPFVSVYEMEGGAERVDPESQEFIQFLGELHDEAFDDAVFELVNEASALYEDRFIHEYQDTSSQSTEAERFLQQHFSPLKHELETLLDNLADDMEKHDFEAMTDAEVDTFIDSFHPTRELSPNFENFGGWFKKKIKKAAKWAKKKAKGLAAKAFKGALKKMKGYLKPLLKKILTFAIGKLPKKYQSMANLLRKKLGYEIEEETIFKGDQDTTGEIDYIQQEFDLYLANLLYSDDETTHQLILAEIIYESEQPIPDALNDLDNAREHFIEGILNLKEGEDPTPLVENFLPAVMWAVKIGLKFYGRPKLVNYLARYLAKLIRRYVGKRHAIPLSKVIVDAGLRLVNLEVTEHETMHAAGGVVASMVEDTLYEVANLPEYILDDEELLDGFVLEAFEKAATRNLPEILPEETYIKRPRLRESKGLKATWIRKLNKRKNSYKKFTKAIKTKLDYHKLRAIKSFGDVPLSAVLLDQYGLPNGADLDVIVHLYEAIPGTTLPQICRDENKSLGLGASGKQAYTQLHPLTPQAAAILFGEPGLGRSMPNKYLVNRRRIGVGQRFYYLEIPSAELRMPPMAGMASQLSHIDGLKLILDFSQQQIRASLFLSESSAQNIAIKLRQKMPIGSVMTVVQSALIAGLRKVLLSGSGGNIKIIHPAIPPQQTTHALLNLSQKLKSKLTTHLLNWLGRGMSDYFRQNAENFIISAEDLNNGVSLIITLYNPPSFALLAKTLCGTLVSTNDINFAAGISQTQIKSVAGNYHE